MGAICAVGVQARGLPRQDAPGVGPCRSAVEHKQRVVHQVGVFIDTKSVGLSVCARTCVCILGTWCYT